MAANPQRAARLADAGLDVLAAHGARGLTHRAVDRAAGEPVGTTSNYHRSRAALLGALADRIFERLQPSEQDLAGLGARAPDVSVYADSVADIVRRVRADPSLWIALVELRLEATRNPDLARRLARTLATGYADDLAFHRQAALPGGQESVALLHYAIDGLLLDALTPSIGAVLEPEEAARTLVERLALDT